MSIGIVDVDMATYTLVPFNLEAMKLSAYYKQKKEVVLLANEIFPDRHQKIFVRKDYNDGAFPFGLNSANVEYGGLAFTKNVYVPLPLEIEKMKPDTTLYNKVEKIIKTGSKTNKKIYDNMFTCEHCRLSLDGQNIWSDYPRQFKLLRAARNIMFHDYDLGTIKDGYEEVKRIMDRARTDGWATKIGMKFPVQVNDGQSLLNWSSLNTNSTFYSLKYNGVIDSDAFTEWVGRLRDKAVFTQIEYNVTGGDYNEEYFLNNLIIPLYHQIIISRSYSVFFSLKFDKGFFTDSMWEKVIQLMNFYHNSYSGQHYTTYLQQISDDTMYDFLSSCSNDKLWKYSGNCFTLEEIRNIVAFVREKNYPLFKDFYECSARSLGGKI